MKTQKENADVKSLKWFLIERFLLIMLFIFISEELMNMAYRVWIAPFLTETMHLNQLSVTGSNDNMMLLMLQMIVLSGAKFLPEGMGRWVETEIGRNMGSGFYLDITSPALEGVTNPALIAVYQISVVFIFLGLFFLTLLPYLISAYWYYKTVSRKVAELLQKEKEQKEAYDRERNLLLSDIAHDIKTPITTVCGYARALSDGMVESEAKKRDYLQAIYAKSMRMDELITLLFEYVKLDSAGFSLHKEKVDLGELLRENVALLYSDIEEKGMELEIEIPDNPFPYEMDKIQMARAVTNILTNAVRYNGKGTKIGVSLKILDEADSAYQEQHQRFYQIRIADTGTPIEDDLAEHIFDPFSRGDAARSTRGGSGLGLSISAKIIQMHGGSLQLDRQCGDGYVKAFLISLKVS